MTNFNVSGSPACPVLALSDGLAVLRARGTDRLWYGLARGSIICQTGCLCVIAS
jgi:hypothetical protein